MCVIADPTNFPDELVGVSHENNVTISRHFAIQPASANPNHPLSA